MALTLNKKLSGGFLLVAGIGLVVGIVGLYGLGQSTRALSEIRSEVFERGQFLVKATDLARSSQVNFKIQVQEWKNVLLRGSDPTQLDRYMKSFGESEARVQAELEALAILLDQYGVPSEKVEEAAETHRGLGTKYRAAITQYDSGKADSHTVVDKLVRGIDRAPTEEIDQLVAMVHAFEASGALEREQAFAASAGRLRTLTSIVMAAGVLVAIGLGLWIGRSLTSQIRRIANDLRGGSVVVESAAAEVSRHSHTLADATNSEAAAIQEASASLELLASNTRENSEMAKSATDIANQTRKAVDDGKRHMGEMHEAMSAIQESSNGISQILKSIDEIAFQTNILALNAAVEAARAGASGAGFAVVADEVRNLAQRSARAAQETSVRIEDSIAKSKRGVEISTRMAGSLDQILTKAQEVDHLVAAIAQSAERNREGVEQVNSAIRQIECSSQSNAAITEESAVAAQELSKQAESLNETIFDLSQLAGGAGSAVSLKPLWTRETSARSVTARKTVAPSSTGRIDANDLVLWN